MSRIQLALNVDARQDKFWVENTPDGERWEIYTVLEDSPTFGAPDSVGACCGAASLELSPTSASCC